MASMPRGVVHIGKYKIGEGDLRSVVVTIKPKAKGKVDKKESDGKDDATTTWKGRQPADVEIALAWDERDTAVDDKMVEILTDLSPRGPNGGEGFEFAERTAPIHKIMSILIEDVDGPNYAPDTTKVEATIKASSWTKPAPKGAEAGKTPNAPQKWVEAEPNGTLPLGKTGNKVGGFGNDGKPQVKP